MVEIWNIRNIVTSPGQYGSAQKPATLAGGYYPPLLGACHVGGRGQPICRGNSGIGGGAEFPGTLCEVAISFDLKTIGL